MARLVDEVWIVRARGVTDGLSGIGSTSQYGTGWRLWRGQSMTVGVGRFRQVDDGVHMERLGTSVMARKETTRLVDDCLDWDVWGRLGMSKMKKEEEPFNLYK